MKIQHLSIIFIVIMLPIILIVSYYLNLQKSTLNLQQQYDQKLIEATKEAMEAFEVNTTEWNDTYSNLSDSKRRDVMASINTFITSMSSKLGMGGISKENMLSYMPAIAFTLYDGYYVYAPQNVPKIRVYESGENAGQAELDGNENVQYVKNNGECTTDITDTDIVQEYKHSLTTFLPYSKKYTVGEKDYIIDYTLDNYIRVYSKDDGVRAGNLVYFDNNTDLKGNAGSPKIKYNGTSIEPEILTEQVIFAETNSNGKRITQTYKYVYDIQNEKYYYEKQGTDGSFFRVVNGEKVYLAKDVSVGEFGAKYRKVVVVVGNYKVDLYQLLNTGEWYVDTNQNGTVDEIILDENQNITFSKIYTCDGELKEDIDIIMRMLHRKVEGLKIYEDCSAINYYVDAYAFTEYAKSLNLQDDNGDNGQKFLNIDEDNNPEDDTIENLSKFNSEKRNVISQNVQSTIDAYIIQYLKETDTQLGQKIGDKYKLIQIKDTDWDQILRNASMITFFEGIPIGLKYYNSYAIAVSTTNNEFINKNEIYFTARDDEYYHSINCDKIKETNIVGYRNTDFIRKKFEIEGNNYYYYLHNNNSSELACYNCLVQNKVTSTELNEDYEEPYYTALARERYIQNKDVQYVNGELKDDLTRKFITYKLNGGQANSYVPANLREEKIKNVAYEIKGAATKHNIEGFVYWCSGETTYIDGDQYIKEEDLTLTAAYKVKLEFEIDGVIQNYKKEGVDEGNGWECRIDVQDPSKPRL